MAACDLLGWLHALTMHHFISAHWSCSAARTASLASPRVTLRTLIPCVVHCPALQPYLPPPHARLCVRREQLGAPELPVVQVAISCTNTTVCPLEARVREGQLGVRLPALRTVDAQGLQLQVQPRPLLYSCMHSRSIAALPTLV